MLPGIADYKIVKAELTFKVPEHSTVTRMVCEFVQADWDKMRDMLSAKPWEDMQTIHVNDAAVLFNKAIQECAEHCIPRRVLRERKSTHPWLTDAVETLVQQKNDAEGTPNERDAAEQCSAGILASFRRYTRKCAEQLRSLIPSSKAWWAKKKQLLDVAPKTVH